MPNQLQQKPRASLRSKFRRLEELKKIFASQKKLSRIEVEELLHISTNTALSYLDTLEQERFIMRKTYANTKTYYYELLP